VHAGACPGFEEGKCWVDRAQSARAKIFGSAPKMLTTPLINAFVNAKEGRFWASIDEKLLFRERTSVASKFTTGLSYQLLIISSNICHSATELAVVPDLRGVLKHPEPMPGNAPGMKGMDTDWTYFKRWQMIWFDSVDSTAYYSLVQCLLAIMKVFHLCYSKITIVHVCMCTPFI
jgi:hypothetical protein